MPLKIRTLTFLIVALYFFSLASCFYKASIPVKKLKLSSLISNRKMRGTHTSIMSLDYIKINAPGREREQRIPTSFVNSFGKWIVNDGKLEPIIELGALEQGWVDPISFEEVWLPLDLPIPHQRPAIAALTKDGSIRCIMPALDISVKDESGLAWRNRGLCSFPLARVWMDLNSADVSKLVLSAYSQVFPINLCHPIQRLPPLLSRLSSPHFPTLAPQGLAART